MKALRSVLAIFLTILVLVSSTNFMVGIHRCGGHVRNIALFTDAAGCPMEQQSRPCHGAIRSSCCQDLKVIHEQEEFNVLPGQDQVTAAPVMEVVSADILVAVVIPAIDEVPGTPYHPPIRAIDRVVTHRVFLI